MRGLIEALMDNIVVVGPVTTPKPSINLASRIFNDVAQENYEFSSSALCLLQVYVALRAFTAVKFHTNIYILTTRLQRKACGS
jgi:hypothetical protein